MAKSRRELQARLKITDLVIEVVDARAPASTRNPDLQPLLSGKPVVLVLNKSDLADPQVTPQWQAWFRRRETPCLAVDSRRGVGVPELLEMIHLHQERPAGRLRPWRAVVVGIPNVGKSALINQLARRRAMAVADRPGVTRGPQWLRLGPALEVLDTPGLLWPKFTDPAAALHLALVGAIAEARLDASELAVRLLEILQDRYPQALPRRYGEPPDDGQNDPQRWLDWIGRRRGLLAAGGKVDQERAVRVLLSDFREGRLGPVSLERPGEAQASPSPLGPGVDGSGGA